MTGSKCMHMLRPLLLLEMEHRTSEMLSMCSTTEYIPMLTHLAQLLLRREWSANINREQLPAASNPCHIRLGPFAPNKSMAWSLVGLILKFTTPQHS